MVNFTGLPLCYWVRRKVTMSRRRDGIHSRSGRLGEEKRLLPLVLIWIVQPVAYSGYPLSYSGTTSY